MYIFTFDNKEHRINRNNFLTSSLRLLHCSLYFFISSSTTGSLKKAVLSDWSLQSAENDAELLLLPGAVGISMYSELSRTGIT